MPASDSSKCSIPKAGMMRHFGTIACDRCGEKFRSAAERIRLEDDRYICSACYQGLIYPDLVFRHSDLPK